MFFAHRIWLSFGVCLAIVIAAMGWLTLKAFELDRAEVLARHQAELEESVGRALWRMDTVLTPILAEEAVRPSIVFQPFLPAENTKGKATVPTVVPSPLLLNPSEHVLLHFQLSASNDLTSPQCVSGDQLSLANSFGVLESQVIERSAKLKKLKSQLRYDELVTKLPSETLPDVAAQMEGNAIQVPMQIANRNDYENRDNFVVNQSANLANSANDRQADQQEPATQPPGGIPQNGNTTNAFNNLSRQRGGNATADYQSRTQSLQAFAKRERIEQSQNKNWSDALLTHPKVREGVSQPLWVGSNLILARRVMIGGKIVVQGCWLDWDHLKTILINEVSDLLPEMNLEPISQDQRVQAGRVLATLPVQLVIPDVLGEPDSWSPIRVSLAVAWGALFVAAGAVALLLKGVMKLSERRGAFVAAVTHELRTPLTTFRMYAEMLAEGMVPQPERRQQYLQTLRLEADRLSHLVENVLQYARLERGRPGQRRELVAVDHLLTLVESRLEQRVTQANMSLAVEVPNEVRCLTLSTDPAAIEQILFNLVDNACKYAAATVDRRIHLQAEVRQKTIVFKVRDHGPGISSKSAKRLFLPFSKSVHEAANSAPGVGLGLALSRRLAKELGGVLALDGTNAEGAVFELSLPLLK